MTLKKTLDSALGMIIGAITSLTITYFGKFLFLYFILDQRMKEAGYSTLVSRPAAFIVGSEAIKDVLAIYIAPPPSFVVPFIFPFFIFPLYGIIVGYYEGSKAALKLPVTMFDRLNKMRIGFFIDLDTLELKKDFLSQFTDLFSQAFFLTPLIRIISTIALGFDATEASENRLYEMYRNPEITHHETTLRARATVQESNRRILRILNSMTPPEIITGLSDENIAAIKQEIELLPAPHPYRRSVEADLDIITCPIYLTLIQQPIIVTPIDKQFSRAYEYEALRASISSQAENNQPATNPTTRAPLDENFNIHLGPTPLFTEARSRIQSIIADAPAFKTKIQTLLLEEKTYPNEQKKQDAPSTE